MMVLHNMDGLSVELQSMRSEPGSAAARAQFQQSLVRFALLDLDDPRGDLLIRDIVRLAWQWSLRAAGASGMNNGQAAAFVRVCMKRLVRALCEHRWLDDRECARYIALIGVFMQPRSVTNAWDGLARALGAMGAEYETCAREVSQFNS